MFLVVVFVTLFVVVFGDETCSKSPGCIAPVTDFYPANVLAQVDDICPLKFPDASKSRFSEWNPHVEHCWSSDLFSKTLTNITCPSTEGFSVPKELHRYVERAAANQCETNGMWTYSTLSEQKCFFLLAVSEMKLGGPGKVILDWGAGCGQQIAWLYQYFGHFGFGVDLMEYNKRYSMRHFGLAGDGDSDSDGVPVSVTGGSLVDFCVGDATDLSYIANNTFDGVTSIAAAYSIDWEDGSRCRLVAEELVRVVKPGGRIWMGWNYCNAEKDVVTMAQWEDECFSRYSDVIEWEMFNELERWGFTIDMTDFVGSTDGKPYAHTAFSIFITVK